MIETKESPPRWIEPSGAGESRLALDFVPAVEPHARLWFFLHGLHSNRRGEKALYFARQVARRGDAFASLDLTGHGDSEGDLSGLSLTRNLADLARGLDYVEKLEGPFRAIYLIGSSMGGLTALWFSARSPGLVTRNIVIAPAFEMAGRLLLSLGRARAQQWRREGRALIDTGISAFELSYGFVEDESRYPTASLIQRLKTPSLILHGSDDEVVPCQLSRQFADRLMHVELVEITGGDHRLTAHKERLFEMMWHFVGPGP
ncbi:MAG TPA: alpha/beta fold hydrolase [Vicinamibacteria bacterium]|nr:alpha/beta fold hydrolase [Vicinamibacteria bacterium]